MEERPGERAHELRRWRKGVYASELTQEKRPSTGRGASEDKHGRNKEREEELRL